ncbi:4,5-DOPA dioxygenase extradiol [Fluviicola taffensis]|uniref:Extradiol ring-cleavage dioxygenase class III protein subunit B n=1 Tax=Fluviicola taffensis (strain DSM 16823 / NCIMB 13979 / RW262) TaxID=755732 RepID=F2IAI1_FLUTR|nr:4,5-DOPA dioxygenase extradiol [Fluviicola taffensis]AEA43117.1 Extradiol ring-cleavage dioxygenase class III protein subunit B [Fluviicola taffensis DSM 16823]
MKRQTFVKGMLGFAALSGLTSVGSLGKILNEEDYTYPVLFIGHGSPMNGIEDNHFSQQWKKEVEHLPNPKVVLVISAHWLTNGTYVTAMEKPQTIHDFGGFPDELFAVQYPSPGSPEWAQQTKSAVTSITIGLDHEWGLDHGTWTVVRHMYPAAEIPVIQLSIDYNKPAEYHYALAQELKSLRKKGVLIIGSGNMVHNLRMVAWDKLNTPNFGFDWAIEANETFNKYILERNHRAMIDYKKMGEFAQLAIPTPDHYFPLIYTLGLSDEKEELALFNNELVGGSLNMTSVRFG